MALNWNIGEENTNSVEERIQFAEYFKSHDPYMHPVVIHSYPHLKEEVYPTLLGEVSYDGASLQSKDENVFSDTLEWRSRSAASGKKWVVANDEQGPANRGLKPDSSDPEHNEFRMEVLYGNLMAGGAGVEYVS